MGPARVPGRIKPSRASLFRSSLSPLSKRTRCRGLGVSLSPLHQQIKIPPRNYYSVAITLLQSVGLPIILASVRLGATKCERRPMAFCGLAPNSAPCSPECRGRRQIVLECNALAVEWHKQPSLNMSPALAIPEHECAPKIGAVISSISLPERPRAAHAALDSSISKPSAVVADAQKKPD